MHFEYLAQCVEKTEINRLLNKCVLLLLTEESLFQFDESFDNMIGSIIFIDRRDYFDQAII